jgi:hypothetical protein
MRLSDHALRTYVHLARFARRSDGLTYPSVATILKAADFLPLYTCSYCGGLTREIGKRERLKRSLERKSHHNAVERSLTELEQAGLIVQTTHRNQHASFRAFRLLDFNGKSMRIERNAKKHTFFIVHDIALSFGCFAFKARKSAYIEPLTHNQLRVLLALLQDYDAPRFGGVDPAVVSIIDRTVNVEHGPLPDKTGLTVPEVIAGVEQLVECGMFRHQSVIRSRIDGHFIRDGSTVLAQDERPEMTLWLRPFISLSYRADRLIRRIESGEVPGKLRRRFSAPC